MYRLSPTVEALCTVLANGEFLHRPCITRWGAANSTAPSRWYAWSLVGVCVLGCETPGVKGSPAVARATNERPGRRTRARASSFPTTRPASAAYRPLTSLGAPSLGSRVAARTRAVGVAKWASAPGSDPATGHSACPSLDVGGVTALRPTARTATGGSAPSASGVTNSPFNCRIRRCVGGPHVAS